MTKNTSKVLLLTGIFFIATGCSAKVYRDFKEKVVIQYKTIYSYTDDEIGMIEDATDVVKKYFDNSVGAEDTYNLLSESYKNKLKQTKEIDNARDYIDSLYSPEFVWITETYMKAWIEDSRIIKITVLAEWSQEGYRGVYVFTFAVVKEGNNLKIDDIKMCGENL